MEARFHKSDKSQLFSSAEKCQKRSFMTLFDAKTALAGLGRHMVAQF